MRSDRNILSQSLPLELEILLCALQRFNSSVEKPVPASIRNGVPDWPALLQLAGRHHVTPQLHLGLNRLTGLRVPATTSNQLQSIFAANLKRNFRLIAHARKILSAFDVAGIRVIPVKGVFLAKSAYGHFSSREVSDIDLLVDESDHGRARELLVSLDYPVAEHFNHQQVFRNEKQQIEIDLHWNIAPEYFPADYHFEQLWIRSIDGELDGTPYRALSDEDSLLLLAVQLAKDAWERQQTLVHLQKLTDLARLIDRIPQAHLALLQAQARTRGFFRILNLALVLCQEVLGSNIPQPISDRARADPRVIKLARQMVSLPELASAKPPVDHNSLLDLPLRIRQLHFYMGLRENHRDKRHYLARVMRVVITGKTDTRRKAARGTPDAQKKRSHLLLVLASLEDGAIAREAWRQWSSSRNLDSLDAEGYWILPLLYRNLSRLGVNDPDRKRLGGVYKQMRMGNAITQPGLLQLLDRLLQKNCDVMPAPVLGLALAGENEAISMNPAELLVPSHQLEDADQVLRVLGWDSSKPLPPSELRPFVDAARYRHPRFPDVVICWRPFGLDCPPQNDEKCWQNAPQVKPGGPGYRLPSPVDQALIACLCGTLLQASVVSHRLAADFQWTAVQLRAREVGLGRLDIFPQSIEKTDEVASLSLLWKRHRIRYRQCPGNNRPAGFWRYLVQLYSWQWQTDGAFQLLKTAVRKVVR